MKTTDKNSVGRRSFLTHLTAYLLAPASAAVLTSCSDTSSSDGGTSEPEVQASTTRRSAFNHGIASGDPGHDRIILWTRLTPSPDANEAVQVRWVLARDSEMIDVALTGVANAAPQRDYTVKVDVVGLEPDSTYFYRFETDSAQSPVGRTRTLPNGSVEHLRLAVASCANYPGGYFHAYRQIAERTDLDLVLHLGDYLYEYGNLYFGDGEPLARVPNPNRELLSLDDYRLRHSQYKQDIDLQEAHRQHPFVTIWDDHEIANDAYRDGAENHQTETEGSYDIRRQAAVQAYLEWMPIRESKDDTEATIYRSFTFGDLLQLTMLDARLAGRDQQLTNPCDVPGALSQERSMLGQTQEKWLFGELKEFAQSQTKWCVIGQQVMFGQLSDLSESCVGDPDQWDGYQASRSNILALLDDEGIDNVVVLTGDAHSSLALDLTTDPFDDKIYDPSNGAGSLAVEFIVPGISSAGPGGNAKQLIQTHPHVKYADMSRQGYVIVDVTPERFQADWYYIDDVRSPVQAEGYGAGYLVRDSSNRVELAASPSRAKATTPAANLTADSQVALRLGRFHEAHLT